MKPNTLEEKKTPPARRTFDIVAKHVRKYLNDYIDRQIRINAMKRSYYVAHDYSVRPLEKKPVNTCEQSQNGDSDEELSS